MMTMRRTTIVLALLSLVLAACEGARNNSSWSTNEAYSPTEAVDELVPGADPSRGVGPVKHFNMAGLDPDRAVDGAALFKTRCSACHKLDERYIGPALAGITTRRQPEWILNMILQPEKMLAEDPVAKELLATYLSPMANQNLTTYEAESILAYFREHDSALPETPVASAEPEEKPKGPPGTN
jgi:mono/diheme cytochrome c family protein